LDDVSGTLTGYAYETVPDKPIIAGQITGSDVIAAEPATLGGLALGTTHHLSQQVACRVLKVH